MPKIDIAAVPVRRGSGYPPPFDGPCAARTRRRLGVAGGLRDFGLKRRRGRWRTTMLGRLLIAVADLDQNILGPRSAEEFDAHRNAEGSRRS